MKPATVMPIPPRTGDAEILPRTGDAEMLLLKCFNRFKQCHWGQKYDSNLELSFRKGNNVIFDENLLFESPVINPLTLYRP